jgi:hypothetical protein
MIDALIGSIRILTDRGINAFGYSSSFLEGRSPPRNCSHETLPFVEAAAKSKLTGSIEAQPGHRLPTFAAFRILDVPIMTARNEDVRRQRVLFGFHCRKLGLNITYCRSKSFQCVLKACRAHAVQSNISAAERQGASDGLADDIIAG